MEKFKVTLTVEERKGLEHLVSVGKAAARKLTHARILLLADEGPSGPRRPDEHIVAALGASPRTIARVRKRFVIESLGAAEQCLEPVTQRDAAAQAGLEIGVLIGHIGAAELTPPFLSERPDTVHHLIAVGSRDAGDDADGSIRASTRLLHIAARLMRQPLDPSAGDQRRIDFHSLLAATNGQPIDAG